MYRAVCGGASLCAVVKADAYGHGLRSALFLSQLADELAVATADEAARLVCEGVTKPINILGCADGGACGKFANVHFCAESEADIAALAANGIAGKVNIKVNTGMNRLGCDASSASRLYDFALSRGVGVKSVYTHFRSALPSAAAGQFSEFMRAVSMLCERPQLHCCASNALWLPPYMHLDMVRAGLGLYGAGDRRLKPSMSAYTRVMRVRDVRAGDCVGYGETVCPCDSTLAVLRAGYGDGFRRRDAGIPRYVSIGGALCPIVGQVCMDVCMADVTGLDVRAGDRADIICDMLPCESLAAAYSTVEYEVMCGFLPRAERIYV